MKILIFFILFLSASFGERLIINDGFSFANSSKYQTTIEDAEKTLTAEDILNKSHKSNYDRYTTGYTNSAFWTKFTIKAETKNKTALIFKNPRAGVMYIDVYIYRAGELLNKYELGSMRPQSTRVLPATNSTFYVELSNNEELTIITRLESLSAMYLAWDISSTKKYSFENGWNTLFWGIFGGVIVALVLYNFMVFLGLKDISFIFYILHAILVLWFQYAYSGILNFMDMGLDPYFIRISTWFVPPLGLLTLYLFALSFFDIRNKNRIFFYILSLFAFAHFLAFFLMLYIYYDSSFVAYTTYYVKFSLFSIVVITAFAAYATYKRYPFAIYFLIGEGLYLVSMSSVALSMVDANNMIDYEYYILPSGVFLEILFSSIVLSKRVKEIKDNNILNNTLRLEEAKFTSIGKSIGNITHQWKEPINRLSGYMTYIQALRYKKDDKKLIEELDETIEKSANIIDYMKGSIDELYSFYSGNKDDVVNVKKKIDLAYKLQQDRLIPKGISVDIECKDDIYIYGGKHALANTLMILFDNAIDQFLDNKQKNKKIKVTVRTDEDSVSVDFYDNAGGVKIKPVQKVFEANISTKGELGSGIGLSLAKKLIEERMEGKISVQNIEEGAMFRLEIPRA